MVPNAFFADLVLAATVIVLMYAAWTDLRHYKIRNEAIALLIVLFVLHRMFLNRWTDSAWNLGLAATIFVILLCFYSRQWMGGGDVKMLAVALLWTGVECALPFAILLLVFAFLHTIVARLGWAQSQQANDASRARIAFAPSVAAALICVFMLGCLRPPG